MNSPATGLNVRSFSVTTRLAVVIEAADALGLHRIRLDGSGQNVEAVAMSDEVLGVSGLISAPGVRFPQV